MNLNVAALVFVIGLIAASLVIVLDWQSSKNFIFYGLTEGNKLTTDRYGYFDVKKNLIISAASVSVIAVAGIYGLVAEERIVVLLSGVFCLIPCFIRGKAFIGNIGALKRGRIKQIKLLRELRSVVERDGTKEEIAAVFNGQLVNQRGGRTYYRLFGWVYSETTNYGAAVTEIQKVLCEIVVADEKLWFPK